MLITRKERNDRTENHCSASSTDLAVEAKTTRCKTVGEQDFTKPQRITPRLLINSNRERCLYNGGNWQLAPEPSGQAPHASSETN